MGTGRFFWLGVSFLLVEVKSISQLALVWGCTWKVGAIVIGVIMVEILLANLVVAKCRVRRTRWAYMLLLASLLASYFFDPSGVASRGFLEGRVWPTLVLLIPLFFAGIVFAVAFAKDLPGGIGLRLEPHGRRARRLPGVLFSGFRVPVSHSSRGGNLWGELADSGPGPAGS